MSETKELESANMTMENLVQSCCQKATFLRLADVINDEYNLSMMNKIHKWGIDGIHFERDYHG